MKKGTLFLLFLFLLTETQGQFRFCDTLHVIGHYLPFDRENITTTRDYFYNYFPRQRRYLSDRSALNECNLWHNADSVMVFMEDGIDIRIKFGKKVIHPEKYFYPKNKDDKFSRILNDKNAPFGITSEDSLVSYIKSITVNSISAPVEHFEDLLNPNRYKTDGAIKPLNAYKSSCGRYIYIYIFGELFSNLLLPHEAMTFSYMSKLVFTTNGYFVNRIVERGDVLEYFGFGQCPNFIGF